MGLRNETGTHRGHRMRKRIEPVGIPRIHAGEDVNDKEPQFRFRLGLTGLRVVARLNSYLGGRGNR
jgi:hypothetical protein